MLHLRCYGSVSIIDGTGEERQLRSRKHVGLLLYLVSRPRSAHSRDDLASLLWDGTGRRERHSLSQALYDIRSNVDRILEVDTNTIQLRPGRIEFEAERFEEAVESGDHETALELYRGDFAPDLVDLGAEFFDRWLEAERERHRVLATIALRNAQRVSEDRGDWDRMCLAALRLVHLNEFDEEAHAALMRGLWMKGDPASALRHFRSLDDELVAGWPELQDLARRLDKSGSVREVLTVPARPTPLIGREREFEELFELVRTYRSTGGSILICGEPGVGKTALLKEFARIVEVRGGTVIWGESSIDIPDLDLRRRTEPLILILDPHGLSALKANRSLPQHNCIKIAVASVSTLNVSSVRTVHLTRLSLDSTLRLIREREPRCLPATQRAAAWLSGGNPKLALQLAYAWALEPPAALLEDDHEAAVRHALATSPQLRSLTSSWIADLSQSEYEAAIALALLEDTDNRNVADALHSSSVYRKGLASLETRGWLNRGKGSSRLTHPLLSVVLRFELATPEQSKTRESLARTLMAGSTGERVLAASQLAAAGQPKDAAQLAGAAARDALADGDTTLASRAARLASSLAMDVVDRREYGLLQAEAELTRGRPQRAERILRQIADVVGRGSDRLRLELLLTRALTDARKYDAAKRHAADLRPLAESVADEILMPAVQLQEVITPLAAAVTGGNGTALDLSLKLERMLREHVSLAREIGWVWLHGFRTLFGYRLVVASYQEADKLLRRFGATLSTLDGGASQLLDLFRMNVELKSARLHTALPLADSLWTNQREAEDRTAAATLNNRGVILTELGDFERAGECFAHLRRVDRTLATGLPDRLHTILNEAQAAWFAERHVRGEKLAEEVMEAAASAGESQIEAEAAALRGLVALEARHVEQADAIAERLQAFHTESRTQDLYLIVWFRAAHSRTRGNDPTEELEATVGRVAEVDALAAAKLMALAPTLLPASGARESMQTRGLRALRAAGASWFARRFSLVHK